MGCMPSEVCNLDTYMLYRGKEKIHSENEVNCLLIQVLQSD